MEVNVVDRVNAYTGIGSRQTPKEILKMMYQLGYKLSKKGLMLRSGGAIGADTAFEKGCIDGENKKEIYLPWNGYNERIANVYKGYIVPEFPSEFADEMISRFHPNPPAIFSNPKYHALMSRNINQLLGKDLNKKSSMVICWTPWGHETGGTGFAIKVAKYLGIDVWNLGIKQHFNWIMEFLTER